MNPLERGEVFVTADGGVTNHEIGHFERFLNQKLSSKNNLTSGKLFKQIIKKG